MVSSVQLVGDGGDLYKSPKGPDAENLMAALFSNNGTDTFDCVCIWMRMIARKGGLTDTSGN